MILDVLRADGGTGVNASWATVIAIATLLLGTSGTTVVAFIQWLSKRGKDHADSTRVLVEAAAGLLTPYATALDMANSKIKELGEEDQRKGAQIRGLRARNRDLERRVEVLEDKLTAYESRYGPLAPKTAG